MQSLFASEDSTGVKRTHLLSSIYHHDAAFFVEVFQRVFKRSDLEIKLAAIRATEEAMQSKGTSLGADIFLTAIEKFMGENPDYTDEMLEISDAILEFKAMFA
ncbi:MAG: hypothetical protein KAT26_03260 [Marinosulfonomonas sp.]|nr:hypothetical protein [Marinosulfonomonas sp.]